MVEFTRTSLLVLCLLLPLITLPGLGIVLLIKKAFIPRRERRLFEKDGLHESESNV